MGKGQSSIEFVLLVSFTILIGISMLYVIQSNLASAQSERDEVRIMQLVNLYETELFMAESSPLGYQRVFFLPLTIDGINYTLNASVDSLGSHDLLIEYKGRKYVYLFPNLGLVEYRHPLVQGYNSIHKECGQFACSIVIDKV